MAAQPLKRRTYWIADVVTPLLRERAMMLSHKGYDVQFFTTLDSLMAELAARRAAIIVVSDDGDEKVTERILLTLMTLSEIQGAKLVMVRNAHSDRINFLTACANFRDIIPSNIDERLWLTRFIYATAGKPVHYVQPTGQITLNNISAVSVPARITWISDKKLRLECRVKPPVGATLNLGGSFAKAAGVTSISLKITETQRSRLLYRFSDAIVAEWNVPETSRRQALEALKDVREHDPGPRCRIFIAAQSTAMRTDLLSRFSDPSFDVSTALQKQSIVDEPRFFTPDIVFIEAALCADEGGVRFQQMLETLSDSAAVVVLGKLAGAGEIQKRHPGRKIVQMERLPKNLAQSILNRYLPLRDQHSASGENACNVMSEHPFSLAEVTFPARLHRLHPLAAKIALPFPIGNFALCRLDSPLLRRMIGRHPYVKLTATYHDTHPEAPPFVHVADCYFADVDQVERKAIVHSLTKIVTDSLARLDPTGSYIDKSDGRGETRTPELGSVRLAALDKAVALANTVVPPPPPAPPVRMAPPAVASAPPAEAAPQPKTPRSVQALASFGNAAVAAQPEMPPIPSDFEGSAPQEKLIPTEQLAELLMPALSPFAQVAGDLKIAAGELRQEVARGVKANNLRHHLGLAGKMIAVVVVASLIIAGFFALLAPHIHKSGDVYTDQLRKFAPQLDERQSPP